MTPYEYVCEGGHLFEVRLPMAAQKPSCIPCPACGSSARRRYCPPHLASRPTDGFFSLSLGRFVPSERAFREELKRKSERDGREYEVVGDTDAWAEFSSIPSARVEGGRLVADPQDLEPLAVELGDGTAEEPEASEGPAVVEEPAAVLARRYIESRRDGVDPTRPRS